MVREVIDSLEADANGRRITWKVDELPAVEADPAMLKLVFVNLLSNAVKYTGPVAEAEIHVGCSTEAGEIVLGGKGAEQYV